jgi:hypothetical protein
VKSEWKDWNVMFSEFGFGYLRFTGIQGVDLGVKGLELSVYGLTVKELILRACNIPTGAY